MNLVIYRLYRRADIWALHSKRELLQPQVLTKIIYFERKKTITKFKNEEM